MIVYCKYCKHFKHTGQDEFGSPYEFGGMCVENKEISCYAEMYCNGLTSACVRFECDLNGAQGMVAEFNSEALKIREEYKRLHDRYRELSEKSSVLDDVKIKAEMLDAILNAKKNGSKNCNLINMLDIAELGLKRRKDNG